MKTKQIHKECPDCKTEFPCCTQNCWCSELPNIIPVTENKDCVCQKCLTSAILKKTNNDKKKNAIIYFITGGERSGKSSYAQMLALSLSENPLYVATSRIWDGDFEKRVKRHKDGRDARWRTIEEEKQISNVALEKKVAVVDCITLWLTNYWVDTKNDLEKSLKQAKEEFDRLSDIDCTLLIISNEIGMGTHAQSENARKFVELCGWMNQYIAEKAQRVIFMVSGIPVTIKS